MSELSFEQLLDETCGWYANLSEEELYGIGIYYKLKKEPAEAEKYFKAAADRGYAKAQTELALLYLKGDAAEEKREEADFLLEKAAMQEERAALFLLGSKYQSGKMVPADPEKSFGYYLRSAKQGDLRGCGQVGILYFTGKGTRRDVVEGIYYIRKSLKTVPEPKLRGELYFCLSEYYAYNSLGERDLSLAELWYEKAVEAGCPYACKDKDRYAQTAAAENVWDNPNISAEELYHLGTLAEKNKDAVGRFRYDKAAADRNLPIAQFWVSKLYGAGIGVLKNPAEERLYLELAAKKGYGPAQTSLGYKYSNGNGVEKNPNKAAFYYKSAAEQNEPRACLGLFMAYLNGKGVSADRKKAFEFLRRYIAGAAGECADNRRGIYFLFARSYEEGWGTSKNENIAEHWYRMAADLGDQKSGEWLIKKNGGTLAEKTAAVKDFNLDSYFEGIIGMDSVKKQLKGICDDVRLELRRNAIRRQRGENVPVNNKGYNFVLLGNPGTGKTVVARIIAKILHDLEIREEDGVVEVDRSGLIAPYTGQTEEKMQKVLGEARGKTLFIDEAYTLYKENDASDFGREAIDILMKDMEDHRSEYSVIIAGYKVPMMNMINNANPGFGSRFNYQIEIPDYTDEELIQIAKVFIRKQMFILDKGAEEAMKKWIHHERIDDIFGNARAVRTMVEKAIENQSGRISPDASDEELFLLKAEDFWSGSEDEENIVVYLKELEDLIGLRAVKNEVKMLINRIQVNKEKERRGISAGNDFGTLHMEFLGNAGTGKTTVARLIGKLYASLGVLKRGDVFVECNRGSLVGEYQGQTAIKVQKAVQSALGGILFIDEAYSLVQDPQDSYGKEALDTLVAEIENRRDSLMVIFAGYQKEMKAFFANNQGLGSRVPTSLLFEDYTADELFTIMQYMLTKKNMRLGENASAAAKRAIMQNMRKADFGNARGIRNMVDAMLRNQAGRITGMLDCKQEVTDEMLNTIEWEDI